MDFYAWREKRQNILVTTTLGFNKKDSVCRIFGKYQFPQYIFASWIFATIIMSTKAEKCPTKKEESKQKSDKKEEENPKNVNAASRIFSDFPFFEPFFEC